MSAVACLMVSGPAIGDGSQAPARASGGCFPAGGRTVPSAPAPATSGIIVQGHGWGHGLGMSQYGAQGAALLGCTHEQILTTYYAGTHLQRYVLTVPVVLALGSGAARATLLAEDGDVAWTEPGTAPLVQPVGQTWTAQAHTLGATPGTVLLDATGRIRMFVSSGSPLSAAHSGATVRLRTYPAASNRASTDKRLRRGTAGFTRAGSGITSVETIVSDATGTSVDKYLWGLGEVPATWPAQALQAQADAARTYLTGSYSSGAYRIGTTTAAQVYAGAAQEDTDAAHGNPWRSAVNATSGELVVDAHGSPITAMYSSSDGARSESRAYVYGSQGGYGYLTSVDDSRWDLASSNPHRSWAKAFTPAAFASALGFSSISAVSLGAPGSAARNAGLKVTGVSGGVSRTIAFTGAAVRSALGLRSPAVTVSWVRPAPPAPVAVAPPVQPLVGDWDGDGRDEVGVFSDGAVTVRRADGSAVSYELGRAGDFAVVGDWDGDGRDSVGVFRGGMWYLRNALSAGPFDVTFRLGNAGDRPMAGKWAGPGRQGVGVVRGNRWYLRTSVSGGVGQVYFPYGNSSDLPVVGDWNGDGVDTPGVFRSGVYYARPGLASGTPRVVRIGRGGDLPVVGNWDGVGGDGTGVVRGRTFYYRDDLAGGIATTTTTVTS